MSEVRESSTMTAFHKAANWGGHFVLGTMRGLQPILHRAVEGGLVLMTGVVTWHSYWWAFDYALKALAARQDALGTAAILAAILGPLTTFQGFTLAKYMGAMLNGNGTPPQAKP